MNTKNVITVADIKEYFNDNVYMDVEYNHRSIDYIDKIEIPVPIHIDDKKMSEMIEKLAELCKNNKSMIFMDSYSEYCSKKERWKKNECL